MDKHRNKTHIDLVQGQMSVCVRERERSVVACIKWKGVWPTKGKLDKGVQSPGEYITSPSEVKTCEREKERGITSFFIGKHEE